MSYSARKVKKFSSGVAWKTRRESKKELENSSSFFPEQGAEVKILVQLREMKCHSVKKLWVTSGIY